MNGDNPAALDVVRRVIEPEAPALVPAPDGQRGRGRPQHRDGAFIASFSLDVPSRARIDAVADQLGVSRARLMRSMVLGFLDDVQQAADQLGLKPAQGEPSKAA